MNINLSATIKNITKDLLSKIIEIFIISLPLFIWLIPFCISLIYFIKNIENPIIGSISITITLLSFIMLILDVCHNSFFEDGFLLIIFFRYISKYVKKHTVFNNELINNKNKLYITESKNDFIEIDYKKNEKEYEAYQWK